MTILTFFSDETLLEGPLKCETQAYIDTLQVEISKVQAQSRQFSELSVIAELERKVGNLLFLKKLYKLAEPHYSNAIKLDSNMATAY